IHSRETYPSWGRVPETSGEPNEIHLPQQLRELVARRRSLEGRTDRHGSGRGGNHTPDFRPPCRPAGIAGTGVDAWLLPAPQTGPDDGQRWLRSLLQIKAARRTRLLLRQLQHRVRLRPPRALAVLTTHSA